MMECYSWECWICGVCSLFGMLNTLQNWMYFRTQETCSGEIYRVRSLVSTNLNQWARSRYDVVKELFYCYCSPCDMRCDLVAT